MVNRNKGMGTQGGFSVAPTVYDVKAPADHSWPRIMAIFWSHEVDIQFGKGAGAFTREADKADIAGLLSTLRARNMAEPRPGFALAVVNVFSGIVFRHRRGHTIKLQWWWVRMLRELATIPDMMLATNRFPNAGLLADIRRTPTLAIKGNLAAAGFGVTAKLQVRAARRRPKPVTLTIVPKEESAT